MDSANILNHGAASGQPQEEHPKYIVVYFSVLELSQLQKQVAYTLKGVVSN